MRLQKTRKNSVYDFACKRYNYDIDDKCIPRISKH